MDFGPSFSCTCRAAVIEIALLGGCPVKQSFFVGEKYGRKKTNNFCQKRFHPQHSREPFLGLNSYLPCYIFAAQNLAFFLNLFFKILKIITKPIPGKHAKKPPFIPIYDNYSIRIFRFGRMSDLPISPSRFVSSYGMVSWWLNMDEATWCGGQGEARSNKIGVKLFEAVAARKFNINTAVDVVGSFSENCSHESR